MVSALLHALINMIKIIQRQARTDGGGGGEKESSVPELCSLKSVCGQACVGRRVFTAILPGVSLPPYFINHNY